MNEKDLGEDGRLALRFSRQTPLEMAEKDPYPPARNYANRAILTLKGY
jgi:hypothetical protein